MPNRWLWNKHKLYWTWKSTCKTIADFTLCDPDFYGVSLVDGFNLPIAIKAINGSVVIVAQLVMTEI